MSHVAIENWLRILASTLELLSLSPGPTFSSPRGSRCGAHAVMSLPPTGHTVLSSQLLASACSNLTCCRHRRINQAKGDLSMYISLPLSKWFVKKKNWKHEHSTSLKIKNESMWRMYVGYMAIYIWELSTLGFISTESSGITGAKGCPHVLHTRLEKQLRQNIC